MAYLMHIGFDNSSRLCRNVYYFEYKGIRFKLIQNNIRKWRDALLTIIPGRNNEEAKNRAYITASEFLSALSWENNSLVKLGPAGGRGIPENFQLRKAKCSSRTFPRIPFCGYNVGYDICRIPQVENNQQRDALVLFREASACNNDYLSFLFFWQVLLVGNKYPDKPDKWVDDAYRKKRNRLCLSSGDVDRLNEFVPTGESIGKYFREACRNAIAHIPNRRPGMVWVKLDTLEDNERITRSTWIVKEFARLYIMDGLGVQKCMCLVRKRGKGFPVYVNEEDAKRFPGTIAYERLSHNEIRKKRWH